MEKKDKILICIYIIPNNFSLFPIAVLSNASCFGEGDNYIQHLATKLMGKYYFWDYSIYVRIIHCHCLKWPHSSLPIGLLILFTQPHAAHQRDGKVLVCCLQMLCRFLYQMLNTGAARSVVVNSHRIFLMHLSFTEKQFTNEWEGFK